MKGGRAGTRIADHRVATALLAGFDIPPSTRTPAAGAEIGRAVIARALRPIEERLPRIDGLAVVEPMTHHRKLKRVFRLDLDAFAPVRIEQAVAIETDEAIDQSLE